MTIINALRVMTTAYLFRDNHVLLMERSSQRDFIPGIWSGVGGHVEPHEYGDIRSSCLREIEEETRLRSEDLQDLRLRYVILRQRRAELRQQFIYFGATAKRELAATAEGTLHWIPSHQVFDYRMTDTNRLMLRHYFDNGLSEKVWVGTMRGEDSEPKMNWALMSDWECAVSSRVKTRR